MFKKFDFITIVISLLAFISVLTIFRFCKCEKNIETFQDLEDILKKTELKDKLYESFVDKNNTIFDGLEELNTKTLDIMSSIKRLKDIVISSKVEEEIEVTEEQKGILDEFNSIKLDLEEEDVQDDDELDENDEENDDLVEGFIEHSTHNCSSY